MVTIVYSFYVDVSSLVGDQYHILGSLGVGVYGEVYKVRDRTDKRVLALKIAPEEYSLRLRREFHFLSQFDHPNIVKVFDFDTVDKYSFFTMELVDGSPINQVFKGYSKELIEVLFQICMSLESIHSQGFLHSDLKPENILIKRDFSVKLLDFGFADEYSLVSEIPRGTLGYIAPEVLNQTHADARSDLYSLGIIIYEVLTGNKPFKGENPISQLRAQYHSEPPSPISLNSEIPRGLNALTHSLISKEPERRPCSAFEVMERLKDSFSLPFSLPVLEKSKRFLLSSPLIGRRDILSKLRENLEKTENSQGTLIIITGEVGVGKSRILKEFKSSAQLRDSSVLFHSQRVSGRNLLSWLIEQIPGFNPPKADDLPEVEAKERKYQLFERLTEELISLGERGHKSLTLLLDDIELLDSLSLDLLRYIALSIEEKPLMVLAAGLPESRVTSFIKEISEKPWVSNLNLCPFNSSETKELVSSLLRRVDRGDELSEWLYEKTDGNPSFVLQTIHSLIEQDFLDYDRGSWAVSPDFKGFPLPEEIEEMVEARLAGLLSEEEEVLKIAAVIGRDFELSLLTSLYPGHSPFKVIESLTTKGFLNVVPKLRDTSGYIIANRILSEAIKKRIGAKERKRLHRKVAEAIEFLYPGREEFIYDLAHYYKEAETKEKSYHYSIEAAKMAKSNYLTYQTLEYYQNAIFQGIAEPDERIDLLKEIGGLQSLLGRFSEAIRTYSEAIEVSKEKDYRDRLSALLCELGSVYQMAGDYKKAMGEFERAQGLLSSEPSRIKAEALGGIGWCYISEGDYDKALNLFSEVLKMTKKMRDTKLKADTLYRLSVVFWYKKDLSSALESAEKSLNFYKRLSDAYHTSLTSYFLGNIWWEKGDMDKARKFYEKALSFQKRAGVFYYLIKTLNNLGLVAQSQFRFDEAKKYFKEAIKQAERIEDKETVVATSNNLGTIFQEEGNWEKAQHYFSKALKLAKQLRHKKGIVISFDNIGALLATQGEINQAEENFQKALRIEKELGDETLLFFLYCHLVQLYLQKGECDLSRKYLGQAFKTARKWHNPQWLSQTLSLLAELKLLSKDFKKALSYSQKAISLVSFSSKEYGIGLRLLGLARSCSEKRKGGIKNLEESIRLFRKSGMRYELAVSLYGLVKAQIDYLRATQEVTEDPSPVFSNLREAEEIFNSLGAKPFIEKIRNLKGELLEVWLSLKPLFRREYFKVFQRLSRLINTELEKEDFLEKVLDLIIEITNAERGLIFLLEDKELFLAAGRNIDHITLTDAERISRSVIKSVKKSALPLFSYDALSDPRFSSSQSVMLNKIRSLLCVPLRIPGSILGTVYLDSRITAHLFLEEDKDFLISVADLLAATIDKSIAFRRMRDRVYLLESKVLTGDATGYCIGKSRAIQEVYKIIESVAPSNSTILLTGETGSGKGVMAQLIHSRSKRKEDKFITVNCGVLPETLFESELFGHRRGSFTGAVEHKRGLFEEAEGGTIFFDEIANTSPAIQAKLLQALEEKVIRRIGETKTRKVDVRLICATNYNLEEEVKKKKFREDLFYRLNVVNIRIPPLRERPTDIPLLVNYFIEKYVREMNKDIKGVSPDVMKIFLAYRWSGNIRELQNTIEKAMLLTKGPKISIEDIDSRIRGVEKELSLRKERGLYEKERIIEALELCKGNVTKTAGTLGFHRYQLQRLLKKYRIKREQFAG